MKEQAIGLPRMWRDGIDSGGQRAAAAWTVARVGTWSPDVSVPVVW